MLQSDAKPSSMRQAVGLVLLLGVSYMFNAMDRQVFPALLGSIRADYGLTLPEAARHKGAGSLQLAQSEP